MKLFHLCPALSLALLSHAAEPIPAIHEEYNASLSPMMPLEEGWNSPPLIAQTRVWWWWLNGNTDKATITRELEAMKAVSIGGANIIDAGGDNQDGNRRLPKGPTFASPEWIELFRHAIAEADRLGLEMGFNIQSGWNLGGPSVTPEESSKKVTFSRVGIQGGKGIEMTLPQPASQGGFYADVAVLAVPLPAGSENQIAQILASSSQPSAMAPRAIDASTDTFWVSSGTKPGQGPTRDKPETLSIQLSAEVRANGLEVHPRPGYGPTSGSVTTSDGREIATFESDGISPFRIDFRPMPTDRLTLHITSAKDPKASPPRNVQIAEIRVIAGDTKIGGIPSGPKGAHLLAQKAYFQYPGAFTAAETWHLLDPGPETNESSAIRPAEVIDLSSAMSPDGRLRWDAPPGRWEILRFGSTLSGAHVSTHSEGAGGWAIDYLDRATLDSYWSKTLDPIFAAVKPYLGKSLRFLHTDSWELGPVNWTRLMPGEFRRLRGYDIHPWLPVLAGHIVGSRGETDRFLNDFRRTLADLMAENKYQGFSEKAHALGMGIHPESGGPHAGPMDALRNLGISDVPMGEFWSTSPRHRTRDDMRYFVKQTTSAAHVYGRRVSLAEAFTNIGRHWQHDPRSLKSTFDRASCEGHNLTMWHTFPSSKAEHGMPGAGYFAGEHFNPNITWWNQSRAFIDYMNRCHFLLQQGLSAADVLHFYGENIPSFVRLKRDDPAKCLPGYDYDIINAHALLLRVRADDSGHAVLPEGTRYRLISLVGHDAISLPVLRHLESLVQQGVTLVGPKPQRAFSLTGGAPAEKEFHALTTRLWGTGKEGLRKIGKGRVIWGKTTREVLQGDRIPEDFTWSGGDRETFIDFYQRLTDDARIYFVANRNDRSENVVLKFRDTGRIPEIWDPVTGSRVEATRFRFSQGVTELPWEFDPEQAFFVIFRKSTSTDKPSGEPNQPDLQNITELSGPWQVSFDPKWGGPADVTFDKLVDWTTRPEEGIRHYSGAATYRKEFIAPTGNGSIYLDLGMVESLCEVRINGKDLGVWWSFPFRRDISSHLKPGKNTLEVKVVNLWCNRIIGDAKLPPEQRRTRTNITRLTAQTPLEPSGLLGPVRLLRAP
ncbi:MAG: hypothetical protein MUF31_03230 [Akkermansiaceae bacterium]|jgi:hypothetical protein|nr:hypothetical protein [Akkermansiaceae bacterium]